MQILIKSFNVSMEVKSRGIEFEVRSPDGSQQLGDCYLTMTGLIWCKGKKAKKNGVNIRWDDLTAIMSSKDSVKKAIKAAKPV